MTATIPPSQDPPNPTLGSDASGPGEVELATPARTSARASPATAPAAKQSPPGNRSPPLTAADEGRRITTAAQLRHVPRALHEGLAPPMTRRPARRAAGCRRCADAREWPVYAQSRAHMMASRSPRVDLPLAAAAGRVARAPAGEWAFCRAGGGGIAVAVTTGRCLLRAAARHSTIPRPDQLPVCVGAGERRADQRGGPWGAALRGTRRPPLRAAARSRRFQGLPCGSRAG